MGCGDDPAWNNIREIVILSTCNRVEIYAVSSVSIFNNLEYFLSETQNVPLSEFSRSSYRLLDEDAVKHLLQVAAGLDSAVIGEPQILGQVADAYSTARKHGTSGKILSRLFQMAVHAGKRARTETSIGHNPSSIASVAVNLTSEIVPDISDAKVMVLGAGEMAELAVHALHKRGANQITVVNRTLERARSLAQHWNGQPASLEDLDELLPKMDIVITSTGAPHTLISRSMVETAIRDRSERPIVFMDIAVPRDVDENVAELCNVRVFDMDTLSNQLQHSLSKRKAEVPKVKDILAEVQSEFNEYIGSLDVLPIITEMRNQANIIRQTELEKTVKRIPELSIESHQQIEAMTKSIVKKILHNPTVRLRQEANGQNAAEIADIARTLFESDSPSPN